MSAGAASSPGEEIWRPKGNPWIIAVAVSLAAFMEVLALAMTKAPGY